MHIVGRLVLASVFVAGCDPDEGPARGERSPSATLPAIRYETDVLPILEAHCFECHGADEAARQADLRLDTRLGATTRRLGGHRAIEPGSPERSSVIASIESDDASVRMPPDGEALTPLERLTLRQWITEGAPYAEHWSLSPPGSPSVPDLAAHPVDAFLNATLARVGVEPAGRAEPAVQLRRLTLALTGLPPSLEELDAFLADPSDAAYEEAVDRLLSSERHAEHLARDWLDHVGYGDSNGMYMDVERDVWAYREWVIDAFLRNEPLDRFVRLQLAGDLGESPSTDDQLATAFLRLHRTTEEGGIFVEELRAQYASDRAVAVANTMLGLTLQCARCHTHRYDPLTQRDFYRLTACFNRVADQGGTPPLVPFDAVPVLVAAGPRQRAELTEVRAALSRARTELARRDLEADLDAWEASLGPSAAFGAADVEGATSEEGTVLTVAANRVSASGPDPHVESWDLALRSSSPISALRLTGIAPRGGVPVVVSEVRLRIASADRRRTIPLEARLPTGPSAALTDGTTSSDETIEGEIVLVPMEQIVLAAGESLHVLLDLRRGNASTVARLAVDIASEPSATLDAALRATHALPRARRSAAEHAALRAHYALFHASDPEVRALAMEVRALAQRESELSVAPHTRVMRDDDPSRVTYVLSRGDFFRPLDEVQCGIPDALTASDPLRDDRGAVAEWLVGPENPLTARVLANRLWQVVFGRGIVATSQDFGTRGAIPSHPELLDWLATDLVSSGWDGRHLLRLLVTSEAFRRSSVERDALRTIDPDNELLARGPRRRLDAEVLRDQALFLSGLLVERSGGRSVRPYHPPGLYEQLMDFPDHPMRTYRPDRAPGDLHRRSLYTFWRRGMLLPSLSLLDAPDRLAPVARREATITPTQALALMNEPLFVEAARVLAERARRESPTDVDVAIGAMFRRATARDATPDELALLRAQYDDELAVTRVDPFARGALDIGEADRDSGGDAPAHAAMTAVARTILTLSETITGE